MLENKKNNKKLKNEALGKGIRSLLQNIDSDLKNTAGELKSDIVTEATGVIRISIQAIEVNPNNPRRDFDSQALNELADSIKLHDIIQPLTVSKINDSKYRLIAGERRFRAAKLAGLSDVPVYIRQANDKELLELALLENLQREDLNAIEIALSYKRMMDELSYTQEKVAERMGKDRTTVTNYLRVLRLPPDIQLAVRNADISMGHARALISLDAIEKLLFVFNEIKKKNLSVRQTEELVKKVMSLEEAPQKKPLSKNELPPAYKRIEDNLTSHFSTKVKLSHNKNGHGSINIEYYSLEELNKLLDVMQIQVN